MTSPQPSFHPRPNYAGEPVKIKHPDTPTPLESWGNATVASIAIPDQPMPATLNGISLAHWRGAPGSDAGWNALAAQSPVSEPAFAVPSGKKAATGAIVVEPDGRVWLVAPTNRFGGYRYTFPKGTMTGTLGTAANALNEVFEESGLQIELLSHFIDTPRTRSFTRYYLARRLGGNPAKMGWESQAVLLVPAALLKDYVTAASDQPILAALKKVI